MALHYEILAIGQAFQAFFQRLVFRQREGESAAAAGQMVMVAVEGVAQFQLIFPADLQPLRDAYPFKQGNRPVNAGPVDLAAASRDNFAHRLRLFVFQGGEYTLPSPGQALAMLFQGVF
jgi:hypothetical protein